MKNTFVPFFIRLLTHKVGGHVYIVSRMNIAITDANPSQNHTMHMR